LLNTLKILNFFKFLNFSKFSKFFKVFRGLRPPLVVVVVHVALLLRLGLSGSIVESIAESIVFFKTKRHHTIQSVNKKVHIVKLV